jgi:hypothetical protein
VNPSNQAGPQEDRPDSLIEFVANLPPVLPYKGRFLLALLRNRFRTKTVILYPHLPTRRHVLWKLCHVLGWRMTSNLHAKADMIVHFRDETTKQPDNRLEALAAQRRVINIGCTDIMKSRVEAAFVRAFGYGSFIDPRNHAGYGVKKSELNGQHNYEVTPFPVDPEPGFVYQKLLYPVQQGGLYHEHRIPVFGSNIPLAVLKLRSVGDRFASAAVGAVPVAKYDAITPDEEQRLLAACRDIGLDYGELDVMRDSADGRLYLLDMNDTPSGIYVRWSRETYNTLLSEFSAALEKMLDDARTQEARPQARLA